MREGCGGTSHGHGSSTSPAQRGQRSVTIALSNKQRTQGSDSSRDGDQLPLGKLVLRQKIRDEKQLSTTSDERQERRTTGKKRGRKKDRKKEKRKRRQNGKGGKRTEKGPGEQKRKSKGKKQGKEKG